jgi:hypothetical protein
MGEGHGGGGQRALARVAVLEGVEGEAGAVEQAVERI